MMSDIRTEQDNVNKELRRARSVYPWNDSKAQKKSTVCELSTVKSHNGRTRGEKRSKIVRITAKVAESVGATTNRNLLISFIYATEVDIG